MKRLLTPRKEMEIRKIPFKITKLQNVFIYRQYNRKSLRDLSHFHCQSIFMTWMQLRSPLKLEWRIHIVMLTPEEACAYLQARCVEWRKGCLPLLLLHLLPRIRPSDRCQLSVSAICSLFCDASRGKCRPKHRG